MDFDLDVEQRMIQSSARQMVERHIEPVLRSHPKDRPLPKDAMLGIFAVCAEQGLTAARLPEEAGGAGMTALTMGLMYEQIPPAIALDVIAHEGTVARMYNASTPEQRERLLPDLIAGRKIACTANTEPDVGSDPRSVRTRIRENDERYVVNGRKMWITNASIADVVNVTGSVGTDENNLSKLRRIVVERAESRFEAREIDMLGLQQGHLSEILFEDCEVPKYNALGEAGDASKVLTLTWLANRPIFGLFAVHLAQRALDIALAYAKDRSQFGKPIASYQLVQELLAEIAAEVTSARLLCYMALSAIDRGVRANHVSAMAKRRAIIGCQKAVSLAMEVHGAIGLSREAGLEQIYRDVRMLTVPDGTTQILTLIEGRELTGIQAYRT